MSYETRLSDNPDGLPHNPLSNRLQAHIVTARNAETDHVHEIYLDLPLLSKSCSACVFEVRSETGRSSEYVLFEAQLVRILLHTRVVPDEGYLCHVSRDSKKHLRQLSLEVSSEAVAAESFKFEYNYKH